ncbi:hypothetical protein Tco_0904276 [Tanacetum coccineum]
MQVRCPQFREDLKSLQDSKEKKKVDGGEMNVVDNGGDEFLMMETSMDGILREEKPKWVLDNAASSHIVSLNLLSGTRKLGHSTMELRSLIS